MGFSEICNGHDACPFCGSKGPTDDQKAESDRSGELPPPCCEKAGEIGFWDETDGNWRFWHTYDDCAKEGSA